MITFDSENKIFYLSGKTYSYVMCVNAVGLLQQLYYGKKIAATDVGFVRAAQGSGWATPNPQDINNDMCTDWMLGECGSYAHGDFHSPTVAVRRGDGGAVSRFKYARHAIVDGAIKIQGMPCVRKADKTLVITLKDDFSDTEIDLNYSVRDNSDVLVRNIAVRNVGGDAVRLDKAFSFCVDLPDFADFSVMCLAGNWASERTPVVTPLRAGTFRADSSRGYSSHQMNPFLGVLINDCNENSGECYGFNLIYSGSFAITAEVNPYHRLRVQGGINDEAFGWYLEGGDTFVTPQAAICYSASGIGGMSREYHDFYRECIINPDYVSKRRPIVINNWEGTYFDFDNEKLFAIIDAARDTGIDTFVLDDGWFGNRDSDRTGLGDWFVNDGKLKGGLGAVIDHCKQNGLKFGLWFEPEMVSEDSDLFRAHPDWAIHKEGVQPCRSRNQLVLDLSRSEVVDYIYDVVAKILSENDISYVKWDKNREITECYTTSLPADRQGEFAHRYTLGFYELIERLTTDFPEVFFEGCASGGGRFDGGALYYHPQIWTSDDTDALERTKIQWGTSICYPVSSMSCHVSACPNHQTQRTTPFATRGAIASLGATGYELDMSKLTAEEKRLVCEQTAAYRQIDDLVLDGDLYRITSPFETNYFCEMLVAKDKSRAYVVGERFRGDPCDHDRVVRLNGLDANKVYRVAELGLTASGAALMNVGLLYPRLPDCGSWTWHIDEVKG